LHIFTFHHRRDSRFFPRAFSVQRQNPTFDTSLPERRISRIIEELFPYVAHFKLNCLPEEDNDDQMRG
jgi:hypothetical protein